MLEKAKGARDVLNRTPLIVPQGILREARSFSVYKTIGETSKERFLPGEAVMLAKMKGGLLDFGPDYLWHCDVGAYMGHAHHAPPLLADKRSRIRSRGILQGKILQDRRAPPPVHGDDNLFSRERPI